MPNVIECLASVDPSQLLEGSAAIEQIEAFAAHLETCSTCARLFENTDAILQIANALATSDAPAPMIVDERKRQLMDRLSKLCIGQSDPSKTTSAPFVEDPEKLSRIRRHTTDPFATMAVPQDPVPNAISDYSFLAPPQQQEEIGRLGDYRVLGILGEGGMGYVFRGEDTKLKQPVALKVMKPSFAARADAKARFLREAQAAAKLRDADNVVTIYGFGEAKDGDGREVLFLAMALLHGESLEERLKREERLPLADVLRIGIEVAQGLAAAHGQNPPLLHRDIKPHNIWLDSRKGRAVILDFGLARDADSDSQFTQSGHIVGTIGYMSPEQADGSPNLDVRTDLFGLGCVLYRMCTGQLPFAVRTTTAYLGALALGVQTSAAKLLPSIPPRLDRLIMRLLAKAPADRPTSAWEVIEELKAISTGQRNEGAGAMAGATVNTVVVSADASNATDPQTSRLDTIPLEGAREKVKHRRWLLLCAGASLFLVGLGVVPFVFFREPSGENPKRTDAVPRTELPKKNENGVAPKEFTNSLSMKFAWVAPGTFVMGSPKEEIGRNPDEIQHKVTLTKGFYMSVYSVTQEQWQAVMDKNPSYFKGEKNLPVEQVSWEDCQEFILKLREKDNKQYRLPTEAEWEYACRAGTTTPFYFGDTITDDQANYNGKVAYGNGKTGVNRMRTVPVGSFPENDFGLFDMSGNVFQWCQDRYGSYPQEDVVDPQGPPRGTDRVIRGGCRDTAPEFCRSAYRLKDWPGTRLSHIGCRLCFFPD